MAISTNARTKTQKDLHQDFIATLDDPEFAEGELLFSDGRDQTTTLKRDGEEIEFPSYAVLREYIETGKLPERATNGNGEAAADEPAEDENPPKFKDWFEIATAQYGALGEPVEEINKKDLREMFKEGQTPKEAAANFAEVAVARRTAAERKRKEEAESQRAIEEAEAELETEIRALIDDVQQERTGELEANEARYRKGGSLVRLEDVAERFKKANHPQFRRSSAVLDFARAQIEAAMEEARIVDGSIRSRLSAQEVSMTRKVWRTFMHDDMETTFRLVDTKDPNTGEQMADDAGNPPEMPMKAIALNKLYKMAKFYNPEDHDKIVAFAHRHSEKSVTKLRQLMDEDLDNAAEVIDAVEEYLESDPKTDDGEPFDSVDAAIASYVAREKGETPPEDVKSIKVAAAFEKGSWTILKTIATALFDKMGWQKDASDEAPNTQLLERLISLLQFEDGPEAQVANVAELFNVAGDITTEEASAFVAEFTPVWLKAVEGEDPAEVVEEEDPFEEEEEDEE